MNLTQAEAIASLYKELIESIDKTRIPLPIGYGKRQWTHDSIDEITLDGDSVAIKWSRYIGCGENENETTYERLSVLFD